MEKSLKCSPAKRCRPIIFGAVATVVLLCSSFWQVNPLRDAVTMLPVMDASLTLNWIYIAFAPFLNVLDYLSFLSLSQHKAVMLALIIVPVLWRALQLRQGQFTLVQLASKLIKTCFISVLLLVLLYAVAALMPRAMSSLQVADQDILLVDFHSHTYHSWDANQFFLAEDNRLWHQNAGFHAAFITDHKSFQGIEAAKLTNPTTAGQGVLLLDGIEAAYQQEAHVMALCATRATAKEKTFGWQPHELTNGACKPLLIQANPGPVQDLEAAYNDGQGVLGIEIHDGAPVGLEEIKHRELLVTKARELDIAVVYGSDNHGWAFAASGWSLLRIPAWQDMHADQLALAITDHIRAYGFQSVQVVERNMLLPAETRMEHTLMPIRLVWRMLCAISDIERLVWFLWLWILLLVVRRIWC